MASIDANCNPADMVDPKAMEQLPQTIMISIKGIRRFVVQLGDTLDVIRLNLQQIKETCCLTNYSLALCCKNGEVITIIDFVEMGVYLEEQEPTVQNERVQGQHALLCLELVHDDYDAKRAKDHMKRVREVILFPENLHESTEGEDDNDEHAISTGFECPTEEELFKKVDLSQFYQEVLMKVAKVDTAVANVSGAPSAGSATSARKLPSDCIKSIALSGWSPPPSDRRMAGDLLYIEATTVDSGILQITACPNGYYVNSSSRSVFDPLPAAKPRFSHSLLECLLLASPAFKEAWVTLGSGGRNRFPAHTLDTIATYFAQGRTDATAKQWCTVPPSLFSSATSISKSHVYDVFRSQQEETFGVEDDKGTSREWNEDLHGGRGLPVTPIKMRFLNKTVADFVNAANLGAVAVVDGHISPFNPSEPAGQQIFFYNGIFFSDAIDNKEFKLAIGNDASRKLTSLDLKNTRLIEAMAVPGLCTLLQAVVDYKGRRLVAQNTIPGVLTTQGSVSGTARLLYGGLGNGERISCKTQALDLMQNLASKLFLAKRTLTSTIALPDHLTTTPPEHLPLSPSLTMGDADTPPPAPLRIDTEEEVAGPESTTVPFIGPFEGKLVRGSDNRIYALEMTRLTPRDANYVAERGTGKLQSDHMALVDPDVATAYTLRSELILSVVSHKLNTRREAALTSFKEAMHSQMTEKAAARLAVSTDSKQIDSAAAEGSAVAKSPEALKEQEEDEAFSALGREKHQELIDTLTKITPASLSFESNPNVFLPLPCDVDAAVVEKDEQVARELALYLFDEVLPGLTMRMREGEMFPLDNAQLTVMLHSLGINMRYLGHLALAARREESNDYLARVEGSMPIRGFSTFWRSMLEVEIIARSLKHVFGELLASTPTARAAPAATIASMLSAVLASVPEDDIDDAVNGIAAVSIGADGANDDKDKKKKKKKKSAAKNDSNSAQDIIPAAINAVSSRDQVLALLEKHMKARFLYSSEDMRTIREVPVNGKDSAASPASESAVPNETVAKRKEIQSASEAGPLGSRLNRKMLLRRACQLLGLQITTKEYNFKVSSCINAADVVGMIPVSKSTEPVTPVPALTEILDEAQAALKAQDLGSALELVQNALALAETVFLSNHQDYIACLELFSSVLEAAGDLEGAVAYAMKALLLQVQLTGLDSFQAVGCHKRLANVLVHSGNHTLGIKHLLIARYLVILMGGDDHPEVGRLYERLAFAVLSADEIHNKGAVRNKETIAAAVKCMEIAQTRSINLHHNAQLAKILGDVYFNNGKYEAAISEQNNAHFLYKSILGDAAAPTVEAKEALLKTKRILTEQAVRQAQRSISEQEASAKIAQENLLLEQAKAAAQRKEEQKKQKKSSYKHLYKNHSRLTR